MDYAKESLRLHEQWGGKIEVNTRVPVSTKDDLSLAYTPGVAQPCLEIQRDPDKSYDAHPPAQSLRRHHGRLRRARPGRHRARGGHARHGGQVRAVQGIWRTWTLFRCASSTKDVDEFVHTVYLLSGSFGGINLEDISAPRCFEIERKLKEQCDIPVFHDDQHGTAIITLAGLHQRPEAWSARRMEDVKIVISGAGAAAHFHRQAAAVAPGVKRRDALRPHGRDLRRPAAGHELGSRRRWPQVTNLRHAARRAWPTSLPGADVFIGVSAPGTADRATWCAP